MPAGLASVHPPSHLASAPAAGCRDDGEGPGKPLPIRDLAAAVGLSIRQLERLFRSQLDTTAKKHYLDRRLQKARRLLAHSALSITEISLSCGFQQQGHFSRQYRLAFGENERDPASRARQPPR